MNAGVTVVVPTHCPNRARLARTLDALGAQTVPPEQWECIVIDNGSTGFPDAAFFAAHLPPGGRIVAEPVLGLTAARRRGLRVARHALVVFVDDDNVLAPDYLATVQALFDAHPRLGAAGGKSLPDFEIAVPPWATEFLPLLALRDLGGKPLIASSLRPDGVQRNVYPPFAPIGAGMALRCEACADWLKQASSISDRCGGDLTSGGDNDLVLAVLESGWAVGYFPELVLTHLIPAARLEPHYLARLNRGIQTSWMRVLSRHDANPWPPLTRAGAALRKAKAWLVHRAWTSAAAQIRWQGACGHFEGRVRMPSHPRRGATSAFGPVTRERSAPLRSFARLLGVGPLVRAVWHAPVGRVRSCWRNGGPWAERQTELGRREMIAAARQLPPLPPPPAGPSLCVHLLTGREFWYQALFCLHSLAAVSDGPIAVEFHDDGTLDSASRGHLAQLGPAVRIHPLGTLEDRLDQLLPRDRYPVLRERRDHYPNLRKLIDPHIGSSGWKLVLDSDLLFFRRPALLLDWLAGPDRMLHATDCTESYGYSRPLLERLAGAPIPPLVNVGLCGLRSEALDWDRLESWCAGLLRGEGTNYYLEQALVAMLAAGKPRVIAPAGDYVTRPERREALEPRAIMHHYVAESKRWYFQTAWRRVVPTAVSPALVT